MKILVLSDTHGYLVHAREVLRRIGDQMDMVFHCGDMDMDAMTLAEEFPELPFHFVKGNNEYMSQSPREKMVCVKGKRFLLTHGHKQRVHWDFNTIGYWAEEKRANAVVFGHTHRPFCQQNGKVFLFNPGSISMPRDGVLPTFGILEMDENGILRGSIMEYHKDTCFVRRKG